MSIRFAALVALTVALTDALNAAGANARPNIVFLLTDDQTARAVGCYGNSEIKTPNLDRLARSGVRFSNHYNTTSICMASRASVVTGLYEYRHGCNFDHGDLERRFFADSYPMRLRDAGYYTGFAGKIGFTLQDEKFEAFRRLFDGWAGASGLAVYNTGRYPELASYAKTYPHTTRAYAAWSVDFMKAAKASGKPFCLSISFKAPHLPFTPDPLDAHLYNGVTFTRASNYGIVNGTHLSPQARTSRAATHYREWITDFDRTQANYYRLIAGIDAAVGMIRAGLESEGLAGNTVIIFTSDNGYSAGAHGFGDKVLPYEEASKSPLIIYDPRLPKEYAGKVSGAVTAGVDMAATILALGGVAAPSDIDGRNLLPLLVNPYGRVRDYLPLFNFWGVNSAQSMAVVTPQWKYVYWYYAGEGTPPTEELFHLEKDRFEMTNVAAESRCREQLDAMRKIYDGEVENLRQRVVRGHAYEPYPVLFDRGASWEQKSALLSAVKIPAPVKVKGGEKKKDAKK